MSKTKTEEQRAAARARAKAWRAANPERSRANNKAYHEANREKMREYSKAYHAANRERLNAQHRAYYEANRERLLAQTRAYRAANPERKAATDKKWREANRERVRIYGQRKQLKYRHGLRPDEWAAIWQSQDGICYLCGDPLEQAKVHLDHDHACCPLGQSCPRCRRGLACHKCNVLIGLADDDPERLRCIADNLEAAIARLKAQPPADEELVLFELP